MINPNDPASATLVYNESTGKPSGFRPGLSIRAEIAKCFMAAMLTDTGDADLNDINYEAIACCSVRSADQLIDELNKT